MTKKPPKKLTMSEAFTSLEEIVAEFEEGSIDLEKSLPKFKQGLELAKFLKKRLKTLENEIIEIQDQFQEVDEDIEATELGVQQPTDDDLPF